MSAQSESSTFCQRKKTPNFGGNTTRPGMKGKQETPQHFLDCSSRGLNTSGSLICEESGMAHVNFICQSFESTFARYIYFV